MIINILQISVDNLSSSVKTEKSPLPLAFKMKPSWELITKNLHLYWEMWSSLHPNLQQPCWYAHEQALCFYALELIHQVFSMTYSVIILNWCVGGITGHHHFSCDVLSFQYGEKVRQYTNQRYVESSSSISRITQDSEREREKTLKRFI